MPATGTHHLGIIDLGSNSARLVVARYTPGQFFKVTYEYSRRVRLAEGMAGAGRDQLQPDAMARAIETLRMFQAYCAANGVRRLWPVATAATRDAVNQREFLQAVRAATGLRLKVLTGEAEAYYGVLGALNATGLQHGLVLDVGGGSAQVSQVRAGRFIRGQTTALGAVRLTEAFLPGERVSAAEVKTLARHLQSAWAEAPWMTLRPGERFVGLGGGIRTLARIDRDQRGYPLRLLNGYELALDRIDALIEQLRDLPVRERARRIPGLPADRADVILAGAMVVAAALRRAGTDRLWVSDQGLREGLLYEAFRRPAGPVIPDLRRFGVLNLARAHGYHTAHEAQVGVLAEALFRQLKGLHGLEAGAQEYLWAAAQLNDVGTAVNHQDHHKHSAYLILNAGLPGYSHRELALIALLCMYHHRGKADFEPYAAVLKKRDAERIHRLGALLRLAEALDSSRAQEVAEVRVGLSGGRARGVTLRVIPRPGRDVLWEVAEAQRSADLFEAVFGRRLRVVGEPAPATA